MGEVLVIQLCSHMNKAAREKLKADLEEQLMNGGPIILPHYTRGVLVSDDVQLDIQNLPGGENHFIGGTYYEGKKSRKASKYY